MFQNFNQKNTQTTDKTNGHNGRVLTAVMGTFHSYITAPPFGHPLLSPIWRPGDSMAAIFRDSSQQKEASDSTSMPFCKALLNPGVCGFRGWEREAEAGPGRGRASPYRGRSVLLCRVFRAVPSSRGRALCRLDMATVFLRSITA